MKKIIVALAAAGTFLLTAAPALACDCANCPKGKAEKTAATADNAPAPKPTEKPKCDCQKGGECLCAKAGKPCNCGKPAPKA